jgi:hypothetical protein
MTQHDFLSALESQLQLSGQPFERAELQAWVASMWPWCQDDPDPVRWAAEFLEARRAVLA